MNYLYGFASASFLYWSLSHFFPATETLILEAIYEDETVIEEREYENDGVHTPKEAGIQEKESETQKGPHLSYGQV